LGLSHAAAEMKVTSEMVGPETYDPDAEHAEFQRAVARKPAGILVSVTDSSVMTPDIDAALQQGIPVIAIDSDAPSSKRLFFVGTNNYNAGMLGGHLTSKLLNGKGNVVIFTIPGQPNMRARIRGYQGAFAEHPDIKITRIVDMKGDPRIVLETTRQLLDAKAEVDAFVCLEAIGCAEVGEVVSRANMVGKVKIVAMDTDQRTIEWIQKGVISATVGQKPFTMAYYGAKLLYDLHHHPPLPLKRNWAQSGRSPVPTFVDTGAFIVDRQSVASFLQQSKSP
jgi:ribose transport system substrate-binding protein